MKIDSNTKLYGIFGGTVEHSLSPLMHNASFESMGFNCAYLAFGVPPENLREALLGARAMGFGGLSITIPHKQAVMEFCDEIDPAAKMIGAVNTIKFDDNGTISGYNTDGIGASRALGECGINARGLTIVMLGAGGAARGVAFQMAKDISRAFGDVTVETAPLKRGTAQEKIEECDLVINTTSIGMYPDVDQNPVEGVRLPADITVFDIVYNPMQTKLLREAECAGASTIPGDLMLVYQALEQERIWLGMEPPAGTMLDVLRSALAGES